MKYLILIIVLFVTLSGKAQVTQQWNREIQ